MDKGLKILLNTYWDNKGWKDGYISSDDLIIAKNEGYMFDYPVYNSHDNILKHAKEIIKKIRKQDVATAFLFSLSTRKLEYRSALASYYYIKSIPAHNHSDDNMCEICGWVCFENNPSEYELKRGLNVYNFERYKWGGVRHDQLAYAKFDLEQFIQLPKVNHTAEDVSLLSSILEIAEKLLPKNKAGSYSRMITSEKILKSNKAEIDILLEILGLCDIFNTENYKGYLNSFTNSDGSRDPFEETNDYKFPLNRWHASDGVNSEAVHEVFNI